MAQQPILVSITRIIETLRAEGSLSPRELMMKVGASRRTFYRALSALKDAGVVVEDGGRYYWYEFVETRIYESEFEHNLALNHSRNIALGLKHIIEGGTRYLMEGDLMPKVEYAEHALMHLRTGYRGTYEVVEKAENIRRQVNKKEQEFEESVKARLLASSLQVSYPKNVVEVVLEDIKGVLRGRAPYFLTDLKVEGEEVKSGGYILAKKEVFEPLKHFLMEQEELKENKESCGRIVELESKYYILRQRLERGIESLIMQVENRTPLKGSCQLCPKVKIVRRAEG